MTQFLRKLTGLTKVEPKPTTEAATKTGVATTITQPSPEDTRPTVPLPPITNLPQNDQLVSAFCQSVGRVRDHNEDSLFVLTSALTNEQNRLAFGLYIVADGMGGHTNGEVASGIAVRAISTHLLQQLFVPLINTPTFTPTESPVDVFSHAVEEAHKKIGKDTPGGGTTLTAILILGDQMTIAHIGDSRAYHIRPDGTTNIFTRDHSYVRKLVEMGQITLDEAAQHPQRNVLYRALGQGESFEADIIQEPLPKDGWLLVCSDGLWGLVAESEIVMIINSSPHPELACQRLVTAANNAGGPDNITAVLVKLPV